MSKARLVITAVVVEDRSQSEDVRATASSRYRDASPATASKEKLPSSRRDPVGPGVVRCKRAQGDGQVWEERLEVRRRLEASSDLAHHPIDPRMLRHEAK